MRYFWETISSWAYWRYVLFSRTGAQWVFGVFGSIYFVVEALDFFKVYTRDEYASYAFLVFLAISVVISILLRRPIKSALITFPSRDFAIEVRIGDLFDVTGAIMISTNTDFEADVAGGRIAPNSLQGQFTVRYFTGNQIKLITELTEGLRRVSGSAPYPMGTTVPITTHGKTFYFTAMSTLNDQGNASTTIMDVKAALNGLWSHVRTAGELQELAVPLVGTGRGRLSVPRRKMIEIIAESFVEASLERKFTDLLLIVIHPNDARRFEVNLYEIKDHLRRALVH